MLTCSISLLMSTAANGPRLESCKRYWVRNRRGEPMGYVRIFTFRLLITSAFLALCLAATTFAQTPSPTPAPAEAENPFAPTPAPPLPAGMTGSDANDPRTKLTPGMYDAGESALGLKHILLVKKPDTFQLGADNPDDPKVQKTLGTMGAP